MDSKNRYHIAFHSTPLPASTIYGVIDELCITAKKLNAGIDTTFNGEYFIVFPHTDKAKLIKEMEHRLKITLKDYQENK